MGQYYYGVILNRETRKPIMAESEYKLGESSWGMMGAFAYELSKNGHCYKQRVIWAGDYSKRKDYDGLCLYDYLSGDEDEGRKAISLPEAMDDLLPKYPSSKGMTDEEHERACDAYHKECERIYDQYITNGDDIKPELRYLCDHDRREYFDLHEFTQDRIANREKRYYDNALAILTSDPTCRIGGGGDYFYQEGFEYYGAWSGDVISTEPEIPEGYKKVQTLFESETEIWTPESISGLIHGKRYGYHLPSPNAYTFGLSICHYDEAHCRLACVPREVILQMYADWQKKVDVERVYKAYDLLMRTIKKDPLLEQEHKGLKLEVRKHPCNDGTEYSDTYAIVDEVEMRLYGPYDNKWECGYKHQASLYGIKYDCDLKSRRYFRNLAKERQAVGN